MQPRAGWGALSRAPLARPAGKGTAGRWRCAWSRPHESRAAGGLTSTACCISCASTSRTVRALASSLSEHSSTVGGGDVKKARPALALASECDPSDSSSLDMRPCGARASQVHRGFRNGSPGAGRCALAPLGPRVANPRLAPRKNAPALPDGVRSHHVKFAAVHAPNRDGARVVRGQRSCDRNGIAPRRKANGCLLHRRPGGAVGDPGGNPGRAEKLGVRHQTRVGVFAGQQGAHCIRKRVVCRLAALFEWHRSPGAPGAPAAG